MDESTAPDYGGGTEDLIHSVKIEHVEMVYLSHIHIMYLMMFIFLISVKKDAHSCIPGHAGVALVLLSKTEGPHINFQKALCTQGFFRAPPSKMREPYSNHLVCPSVCPSVHTSL